MDYNHFDKRFSNILLNWYDDNSRELPWRKTKNPYKVWISEIILQQTRVEQGMEYYFKFVDLFPSIHEMSQASEKEILKAWQGLGYYSRARNLHFTSKYIVNELNGIFPNNYLDLLKLKGVGPYTAAAISSICFNEKQAVVDGNVNRFLSRYFGIYTPVDSTEGKKEIAQLANSLISENRPGDFNQGLMEMGATICKPKKTDCRNCVFKNSCIAFEKSIVDELPIKIKKIKVKKRQIDYLVCEHKGKLLYRKREKKDIWQGLYDFPEVNLQGTEYDKILGSNNYTLLGETETLYHILSHQKLTVNFQKAKIVDESKINLMGEWAPIEPSDEIPLPRLIEKYLLEKH